MISRLSQLWELDMVTVIFVGPVLTIFLYALYNLTLHPCRHFPGPWLWRAFRFPYVLSMQRGDLHANMLRFHARYGPVVRIAPNELSYTDARAWRDVYGNKAFERNKTWLKKMRPQDPESVMGSDEVAHTRLRKGMVGAFGERALREQAGLVEGAVAGLADKFMGFVDEGKGKAELDLVKWFDFIMNDISGDLSFGEDFGCVKNGKAHPWVEISHTFGKGLALMASINYYPPLAGLLKYALPERVVRQMEDYRNLTGEKVHRRLALDTDRPDFITVFSKVNDDSKLSVDDMDVNMAVLIFAGSETTASGLSGIMRYLLQNEKTMAKLVSEIQGAFKSEKEIKITTTAKLDYLNAVINEGLRLCPPNPVGVPRVSPPEGEIVCEQWVAGGTYVTVNHYPAFRFSGNFTRPNEFVPERFLRLGSEKEDKGDDMSAFHPFNSGRHTCIGQMLAIAEMRLILSRLLYLFDFALVDPTDVWDWGSQKTFIFWEKRPLQVVMRIRTNP